MPRRNERFENERWRLFGFRHLNGVELSQRRFIFDAGEFHPIWRRFVVSRCSLAEFAQNFERNRLRIPEHIPGEECAICSVRHNLDYRAAPRLRCCFINEYSL